MNNMQKARDRPPRTGAVLSVLKQFEASFKQYKRKRIAYAFKKFRQEPEDQKDLKCKSGSGSYYIIESSPKETDGRHCGFLCGRVVVCHPTGEKVIHPIKEFFEKYEISNNSSIAYPRRQVVEALFPDVELFRALGGNTRFFNFWGRIDDITTDSVVIMYSPGKFYVKNAKSFKQMYTDDVRERKKSSTRTQAKKEPKIPTKKDVRDRIA